MGRGVLTAIAAGAVAILAAVAGAWMTVLDPTLNAVSERDTKVLPASLVSERTARTYPLAGTVTYDGVPMHDAFVTIAGQTVYTVADGRFDFADVPLGTISVTRPGFHPQEIDFDASGDELEVVLEPIVVRALRIAPDKAASDAEFQKLLDLAAVTSVNAFVFDTKTDHDGGLIFYETEVPAAVNNGLTDFTYSAAERLGQAHDAGLYTVTRIPAFLDPAYSDAVPAHTLVWDWLDPTKKSVWEYPLALAVEACEMGFDEIQFDYVRFPSGNAATKARQLGKVPGEDARVAAIRGFLEEAADRLHPLGCAVSADIFGIVNAIENDQGIGQLIEEVTIPIDVFSPMIYPEQWGNGWFGLADPDDAPGKLVASVLDASADRVAPGTITRPWLQSYYYSDEKILAQIAASEARGNGWILWNSPGNYDAGELPDGGEGSA